MNRQKLASSMFTRSATILGHIGLIQIAYKRWCAKNCISRYQSEKYKPFLINIRDETCP